MNLLGIDPWIIWGAVGLVFFILEIFVPGFWLSTLAIGAFVASFVSVMSDSLNVQLFFFTIGTVIAVVVVRPLALRYFYGRDQRVKTNVNALEGRVVIVLQTVDSSTQTGKVKLGGEVWKAKAESDTPIEEGGHAKVLRVDGATLVVENIENGR